MSIDVVATRSPLGAPDAEAYIGAEVRAIIRDRGLDPTRDLAISRSVIDGVVGDYRARMLTARLPPLGDAEVVARRLFDTLAGLGPLQQYLDDPSVEEIWVNEPTKVFIARGGRNELTTTVLTADLVRDLVERMLKPTGRRIDLSHPFVDATLPDGSRLHVAIPDATRLHWALNIRKFVVRARHVEDLVELGTLPAVAGRFLEAAVVAGLNILVAGATQAGKTTMLNCLSASIPVRERVITCEEVFELQVPLPDVVALQTRQPSLEGTGEITLRALVKEALRMRPSRVIVGEVRQQECLDLLIALNSGLPGMCSIHANSAREAVTKMCTLPLLAGENIGSSRSTAHPRTRRPASSRRASTRVWPPAATRRSPSSTPRTGPRRRPRIGWPDRSPGSASRSSAWSPPMTAPAAVRSRRSRRPGSIPSRRPRATTRQPRGCS